MMITLTYALPDVLVYPYSILVVEKSVLSTTFIFKFIGIVFGVILVFLAGLSAGKGLIRLAPGQMMLMLSLALGVNGIRQLTMCLRIMLTKKIIQNHKLFGDVSLFKIAQFSSNHDNWFIFGIMIISAFIPVLIWIKSRHVNEPYKTPAEKRKILKKWLVNKRWAGLAVACLVLSLLNLTELKAIANREVELSPLSRSRTVICTVSPILLTIMSLSDLLSSKSRILLLTASVWMPAISAARPATTRRTDRWSASSAMLS